MTLRFLALGLSLTLALPATGQTVYRCQADGKVTYSDAPCIDAEILGAKRPLRPQNATAPATSASDSKKTARPSAPNRNTGSDKVSSTSQAAPR